MGGAAQLIMAKISNDKLIRWTGIWTLVGHRMAVSMHVYVANGNQALYKNKWSWNVIKRPTGKVSNTSDVIGKVKTVSRWSKSATGCGVTWSVVRVRAPQISRSHSGPVSPLLLSTALREQGGRSELGTSTSTLQAHIQHMQDYMMTGPCISTYVASHF